MIDYTENWFVIVVFSIRGSVMGRALLWAVPSALACLCLVSSNDFIADFMQDIGLGERWHGPFWSAATASLAMLVGFRTNQAWGRFWEGTSLLHQMRGEWFNSISCCVLFSRGAKENKPAEVQNFRHTIVRLMSLCHGSALEEISNDSFLCETIDTLGLDNATLKYLKACKTTLKFNRVEVLLHMVQMLVTKAQDDGVLQVPAPILTRVYQTLSRGFVHCLNARKIADTRFPFPWAQLLSMLLVLHSFMTPCVFAVMIGNKFWAPAFTFISTFALFYLDLAAIELENPFGQDSNDLPLHFFQEEMNGSLMMLLNDDADLLPYCDMNRAETRFGRLMQKLGNRSSHLASYMAKIKSDGTAVQKKKINRISDYFFKSDGSAVQTKKINRISEFVPASLTLGRKPTSITSQGSTDSFDVLQVASLVGEDIANPQASLVIAPADSEIIPKEESIFSATVSPLPTDRSLIKDKSCPALTTFMPLISRESTGASAAPMPVSDSPSALQGELTQVRTLASDSALPDPAFPLCCHMKEGSTTQPTSHFPALPLLAMPKGTA